MITWHVVEAKLEVTKRPADDHGEDAEALSGGVGTAKSQPSLNDALDRKANCQALLMPQLARTKVASCMFFSTTNG